MISPLFKKLNLKGGQKVLIINAPSEFGPEISAIEGETQVTQHVQPGQTYSFILGFAVRQEEVDALAAIFEQHSQGDDARWIAYPKGSSKRYKCAFNRDNGWAALAALGFEPVRIVAIDEDWSALRFRYVHHIKTLTRNFAITEEGRKKAELSPKQAFETPADLTALLHENPVAALFFENLAPSHRREYIRWIEEAKRPETRDNRLQKTLSLLLEGKKSTR